MPPNTLVLLIAKIARREMDSWRESMTFYEIETFVSSFISRLRQEEVINKWEESILRQTLLGE